MNTEQEWGAASREQALSLRGAGFQVIEIVEGLGCPNTYEVFISEKQWSDHFDGVDDDGSYAYFNRYIAGDR